MSINILAIESSCDETSAAVIVDGRVLSNSILSQDIHEIYGGVVPELASRAHQRHIIAVVEKAIREAGTRKERIDAIAFTQGPGLMGSLLVGVSFAKGWAMAAGIPLISVNHMQAHILAHFIDEPLPSFPFLCLTVSGGHTQIVKVSDYLDMEIIGETRDDAAGEAFDKIGKLLGFPYPGGHLLDKYAGKGDAGRFVFPKTEIPGLDYSFSGIKTAVLYFLRDQLELDAQFIEKNIHDLCASVQQTLIVMLFDKLVQAADQAGISEVAIAGGVAANSLLRQRLFEMENSGWKVYVPEIEYCTDNAAMIGMAGYFKFMSGEFADLSVTPDARLQL
ncbi:MAG: tRNA (adenosine(37)-N6)-threonylcarbamoyltransferase complex transferase subunit TsaD [Cyclobacteriaceae bacterium]|nr:tRNA (adenosine(37)-N6)-threonylcarbamoyltransferase complex transferase subunit TsaD [Cyclobacteriaceae bacterium]